MSANVAQLVSLGVANPGRTLYYFLMNFKTGIGNPVEVSYVL